MLESFVSWLWNGLPFPLSGWCTASRVVVWQHKQGQKFLIHCLIVREQFLLCLHCSVLWKCRAATRDDGQSCCACLTGATQIDFAGQAGCISAEDLSSQAVMQFLLLPSGLYKSTGTHVSCRRKSKVISKDLLYKSPLSSRFAQHSFWCHLQRWKAGVPQLISPKL